MKSTSSSAGIATDVVAIPHTETAGVAIGASTDHLVAPVAAPAPSTLDTAAPAAALEADRGARAVEARARATQYIAEQRYAEARKALEEADAIDAENDQSAVARGTRALRNFGTKIKNVVTPAGAAGAAAKVAEDAEPVVPAEPVSVDEAAKSAMKTVDLYSKIAAGVGLLPGGLLNFGAVLGVEIAMVWRIAKEFGHTEGKDRIRGSILSMVGAAIPTTVGHGVAAGLAAIPAVLAGTLLSFVITPVLAYAITRAVGSTFIMHFESGGTLLTFDPKAFRAYFIKEFEKAGGVVKVQ